MMLYSLSQNNITKAEEQKTPAFVMLTIPVHLSPRLLPHVASSAGAACSVKALLAAHATVQDQARRHGSECLVALLGLLAGTA